ncbi:MAG: DNA repair protein RadC [Bacteroidales bacterium]|nr:DNA repair protein RadC [Bacteroidales bacterium]
MKLKELGLDERPREKMMERGTDSLTNAELLAIILRTGTARKNVLDLARELLKEADGRLWEVARMTIDRLCHVDGIGPGKAVSLAAAFELGKRLSQEAFNSDRTPVSSPKVVYSMMAPLLRTLDHEECWAIYLNHSNLMVARDRMTSGGEEATVIDSKAVLRRALDRRASAVIIVHNHPSGNPLPSKADIVQTQNLRKVLSSCDISLLDHVILSPASYYSFADEELVDMPPGLVKTE